MIDLCLPRRETMKHGGETMKGRGLLEGYIRAFSEYSTWIARLNKARWSANARGICENE
jgi:hypothetical protein